MMRLIRYCLMVAGLATLAACSATQDTASINGTSYGLVSAQYSYCGMQGQALAQYLDTGNPTSDDAVYGSQRQSVLSLSGQSRALYIRQVADSVINKCDTDTAVQQQSQAEQQQSQKATQKQQQTQASLRVAESQTCARIGGQWETGFGNPTCEVTYLSDGSGYQYAVAFDTVGDVAPGKVATAQQCATYYGAGIAGQWHSDTDICSV